MPDNGGKPKNRVEITEWDMPDRHELGNLKDFELKTEAIRVFYDARTKMALLLDPDKVWAVYEEASEDLRDLYNQSKDAKNDFGLLDFLLKRAAWEKLKGFGLEPVRERTKLIQFTPEEVLEIESLQDKELVNMVKGVFSNLVVEMKTERKDVDKLLAVFHNGERILRTIYEESVHKDNDLSKWHMMLIKRLHRISKRKPKK